MGRGWRTAQREGRDVTAQLLSRGGGYAQGLRHPWGDPEALLADAGGIVGRRGAQHTRRYTSLPTRWA